MFRRIREHMRGRRRDWEALCNRCGLCCYKRSRLNGGGVFIDYSQPCRFLDTGTSLCRVYDERFRVNPMCRKVTWFHARFDRLMPPTCGYVRAYRRNA
ncbi:MAG: hypothetical protein ACLFUX_00030 [Spirochaetaceae bacterium]